MKNLIMILYILLWAFMGVVMEESGITSPAYYALYGALGLWILLIIKSVLEEVEQ